jgi:C-terminal processing protease CtpA/Prc
MFIAIASTVGLVVVYAIMLAYLARQQRAVRADMYDRIYHMVKDRLYDPSKLTSWEQWQETKPALGASMSFIALRANKNLESLNDPYTYVSHNGRRKNATERDEFVGLGIRIGALYEDMPAMRCAESGAGEACFYPAIVGVFNSSPAKEAGLLVGDLITSINGRSTAGQPLALVLHKLHYTGFRVVLGIKSQGQSRTVVLKRRTIRTPGTQATMLTDKIGYLRISDFDHGTAIRTSQVCEDLVKAKGIIIDLRDNPGGQADECFRTAALFMSEGLVTTAEHRVEGTADDKVEHELAAVSVTREGVFTQTVSQGHTHEHMHVLSESPVRGKRIAIIVNENTASAAEILTGALHDTYGATVYGARTFGKGVGQRVFLLAHWTELRVTTSKYFRPNGEWVGNGADNRIGFSPDVLVPAPEGPFEMGRKNDTQLTEVCQLFEDTLKST